MLTDADLMLQEPRPVIRTAGGRLRGTREAGVAGYLLKPCPKDLLLETVRRWAGTLPVSA